MGETAVESVHVVVGWNDDYESAYLYEASPGETDDSDHSFEADIPAELWRTYDEASKAYSAAHDAVVKAVGFDSGRLIACCPEWVGDESPPSTHWSVMLAESGNPDEWPLHDATITTTRAKDEAEALIARLPERFHLLNQGLLVEVDRSRLRIERGGFGGYATGCFRCGWERREHPDADASEIRTGSSR